MEKGKSLVVEFKIVLNLAVVIPVFGTLVKYQGIEFMDDSLVIDALHSIVESRGYSSPSTLTAKLGPACWESSLWRHLCQICPQVDAFISCFFALRIVATLKDLDKEITLMLNSMGVLSIKEWESKDPNQIEIENLDQNFESFQDLGLGLLHQHPLVQLQFPDGILPVNTVDESQIIRVIKDGCNSIELITKQFEVFDMRELGVVINETNLASYISVLELVVQPFSTNIPIDSSNEKQSCPKLKRTPNNLIANAFITKCTQKLDSPYSPSFSKLQALIETQVKPSASQFLNIVTEYAMMYLGSSKYRAKLFETVEWKATGTKPLQSVPLEIVPRASKIPRYDFEVSMPHLDNLQKLDTSMVRIIENAELRDYIPSSNEFANIKAVGYWGELLVYNYLSATRPDLDVKWMNGECESLASYDLHATCAKTKSYKSSRFIEVKTTKYPNKNCFEISLNEWEFFTRHGGGEINYDIYRVYSAGNPQTVCISVIECPLKLIKEQKIHLCLAI